ncbi:TPA: hypothetical protein ACFP3X_000344 [Neisseria subflava]|mgnify:CR=1 FL=1|jgi:hypothetical protein|uniref:hypothetical protein n=1 Tax=Neisseria TaxID=482 RepID=UPI0020B69E21|nr:hypothetical protein [Neisseria subflava]UTG74002.1 hypothetical protein KCG55_00500 [Neisseria subflava]
MTYRELVERQLAVRHADLELGLSRSREQEPFVIHVSNLLDKAGFEYTVRMNKDFQRKIKRKSKMSLLKTVKMML